MDCCGFDAREDDFELGRDPPERCFEDWLERPPDDLVLLPPEALRLLPARAADEPVVRLVVFLVLLRLELLLFFLPPPLLLDPLEPDFRVDDFFFAGIYSSSGECSQCTED